MSHACTGARCSQPAVEVGRTREGWGGSDVPGTRKFPELLLCTHGGGGCHLLYLTLSLPLQLLNSRSRGRAAVGLGFQGPGSGRYQVGAASLKPLALARLGGSERPKVAQKAASAQQQSMGGRADGTRDLVVLKFTCDPDGVQSWRPKDVSGSCSARRETCCSSQFLLQSFLP